MVERFEVGKWYRYSGKTRPNGWNNEGLMDAVLDGEPRLCILANGLEASFKGMERTDLYFDKWCWSFGIKNWIKVPEPKALYTIQPFFENFSRTKKSSKQSRRKHVLASLKIE